MAKNKIFSNGGEYTPKYYGQKSLRYWQNRTKKAYKKAEELGVLEKTTFYGLEPGDFSMKNFQNATQEQINAQVKKLKERFTMSKWTSDPKWVADHTGAKAHDVIKDYFDKNPEERAKYDDSNIYEVFDIVEAEQKQP